jgi:hypothetical protein
VRAIVPLAARLCLAHPLFAPDWLALLDVAPELARRGWRAQWAVTRAERLRLHCMLDAIVAQALGLRLEDLAWVLRGCDGPPVRASGRAIPRDLDAKGFFRVDRQEPPELRHTVLALAALRDLEQRGLDAFTGEAGEAWVLPEAIRLDELGFTGPDAEARRPVAGRLGPRALAWQRDADDWAECTRHAELVRATLG